MSIDNGQVRDALDQLSKTYPDKVFTEPDSVVLSPAALRRLARLHARMEGAEAVAQVAAGTAQEARSALQAALNEVCEEEGLDVTGLGETPVDIDWRRGRVRLRRQ